jgi:hypothetical protein
MVHPAGKPTCCAFDKNTTEGGTWMIGLSLACGTDEIGPVLPIVTTISMVAPTDTIPELAGKTFIKGLACPNDLEAINKAPMQNSIINFKFFILIILKID